MKFVQLFCCTAPIIRDADLESSGRNEPASALRFLGLDFKNRLTSAVTSGKINAMKKPRYQ
jgi:hypothetical protein